MHHTLYRLLIATLAIGLGTFGHAQENGSYTFGAQATLSLSGPSNSTNINIFSVVEPITGLSTSDDNSTEVYAGFLGATGAGEGIVSLGDLTVAENAEAGTIVGELNATGLEGDLITYEFTSGLGDGNNSLFTLESNGTLRTNTALDYELGTPLRVRILARNENGDTVEASFEVELEDVFEPEQPTYSVDSAANLEMLWVEPGTFTMGSPETEPGRSDNETLREVTLTKGFYLGKYEVTQAQYEAVMTDVTGDLNATPSRYGGNPNRPVEQVSWNDVQVFLTRLNEQQADNLPDGWSYLLPTEAQWEYACRAGTTTAYSWGDDINSSNANYNWDGDWNTGEDFRETRDVGQYNANSWGFYDMHGNVQEWTADATGGSYESGSLTDPFIAGTSDSHRALRGGSWYFDGANVRSASRRGSSPEGHNGHLGFRLALKYTNMAPINLNSTDVLAIAENEPVDTVIGEFNATDPEGGAITYQFVDGVNNNSLFTLDSNGTLKTATSFDYESNVSTFTITVQAKDEHNASIEGNFMITLSDDLSDNLVEIERTRIVTQINQGESLFVSVNVDGNVSMLVRALGPSLTTEGISGGALDPYFSIYNENSEEIATNDDWQSGANSASINLLEEAPSSGYESAEILTLQEGTYTVVLGAWETGGIVALELINLDPDARGKIVSLNPTGRVAPGVPYIQTVHLHGAIPGRFLSMAKGLETLQNYGITDALTNPILYLSKHDQLTQSWELLAENDDWEDHYRSPEVAESGQSSAAGSMEAALVADLSAGEYLWQAEDVNQSASGFVDFTWSVYGQGDISKGFAPFHLTSLSALAVEENQPVATSVGEFNATDPDGDNISYHFLNGENNNSFFNLSTNGTLTTASSFDFESYPNLTVEVLARDSRGAETHESFVVSIGDLDDEAPVISLIGNAEVTHEAGSLYEDARASWTDNVDGTGTISGYGEVNSSKPGIYSIAYNLTDAAGNIAQEVTRTVMVLDTTAPVINLNGDALVIHEGGVPYHDDNATWSDIVDGSGTIIPEGEVNEMVPGTYTLNFNYTDAAGNVAAGVNRTVEVRDTIAPVITLNGDAVIIHEIGSVYVDENATRTDAVDGVGVVLAEGDVDISTPGDYVLSYNYTDEAGNVANEVTRTVRVVDTTLPIITLNGDANVSHEAGFAYIDLNATWSDNVDGIGVVTAEGEVDISTPGDYVLSYNYTNQAGNAAVTVTRTVHVVDTTGPIIEVGVQSPLVHGYRTAFSIPVAEAYDLIDGNVSGSIVVSGEVDHLVLGEHELIYRVSDSHGNEADPFVLKVFVDDGDFDRTPYNLVGEEWLGVEENQPVGTYVGEFNATDPDMGELTYSLVVGEGGDDNERFVMEENGTLRTNEVFDYEQLDNYTVRVRAEVVTGHGVEGIYVVRIWDQVAPVVETLTPEGRDGGLVYVGGRILDAGASSGWSTGMLVSFDLPFYSDDKEGVVKLAQGDNETEYGLEFFPGEDVKKVYTMAYAQNGEGISYGLLEEYENVNRGEYDNRGQGDFWTGAKPMDGYLGWWESWWFGSYYKSDNGWWYHMGLGWVYPSGAAGEGMWLWKEGLNWVWTKEYIYPFLYSHDRGSWYYLYGELDQKRMLYDYGLREWKHLDDRGVDESRGEEIGR